MFLLILEYLRRMSKSVPERQSELCVHFSSEIAIIARSAEVHRLSMQNLHVNHGESINENVHRVKKGAHENGDFEC